MKLKNLIKHTKFIGQPFTKQKNLLKSFSRFWYKLMQIIFFTFYFVALYSPLHGYAAGAKQAGIVIFSYYRICYCIHCLGLNLFFYTGSRNELSSFFIGRLAVFCIRIFITVMVRNKKRKIVFTPAAHQFFYCW